MKKLGTARNYGGNFYIAKEIRESLDIEDGERLELFIENEDIILRKCDNTNKIAQNCARWVNNNKGKIISVSFLGRETMCSFFVNGGVKEGYVTFNLHDKFDLNVAICYCAKQVGFEIEGI